MSIPNKQIGWSNESNLLWQIAKQLERLTGVTSKISSIIEVTYANLQGLISSSSLSPGTVYKITGFNKNMPTGSPENPNGYLPEVLYDDGTNSGVTIYMQAITTNTLSESGYGEFYNPTYGDETTYLNTDGTGLYGIWDGDNPDAIDIPVYTIGQVVYWGGYAWQNLTGNVGSATSVLALNSLDWVKLPYSNTTHYQKVIDLVKVDWKNGIVIGRTNAENQITVEFNADQYVYWMDFVYDTGTSASPISVMGWGIYSKVTPEQFDNRFYGISNVSAINSVCQTVNFKGGSFLNMSLTNSYLYDNYLGKWCSVADNVLDSYSAIADNVLKNQSSGIVYNNMSVNSGIYGNIMKSGFVNYIRYNRLENFSGINFSTLQGAYISYNYLNSSALSLSATGAITGFKNIAYNQIYNCFINSSLATATHVYTTYYKQIFKRQDGTIRLGYYNNSDVFTVVNVTA